MNHLRVEIVKKTFAFILHIYDPAETLKKLSMFFQDRKIEMDSLNLHRYRDCNASVIIHCQVDKDRITRTVQLLEQLPGVNGVGDPSINSGGREMRADVAMKGLRYLVRYYSLTLNLYYYDSKHCYKRGSFTFQDRISE